MREKELKYFSYEFKESNNLGKLYLLPKIHKDLKNVPRRPAISDCSIPSEKVSEFLEKIKSMWYITDNAIMVTVGVVRFYWSIPHQAGFIALKEGHDKRL